MATTKDKFHKLIALAAQPLPEAKGKRVRADNYTDKQTRSRKAASTSAKHSGKSHPKNASADPKNPQ
jgi:hypothetical protein